MIRLIRADMVRLFKSVSFWVCCGSMIAVMLANFWLDCNTYIYLDSSFKVFGERMLGGGSYVMCFSSIFISLFIGTDYANGTIRNKLSAGHSRQAVYFSNFIVCSVGAVIYSVLFFAAQAAAGLAIGWSVGMETGDLIVKLSVTVLAVISACSLLTLAGMMITTKSSSAVISMISTAGMLMIMSLLVDKLSVEPGSALYVESPLRDVLTVICGMLPFGQAIQLAFFALSKPAALALYSLGFIVITSAAGIAVFKHKDLK